MPRGSIVAERQGVAGELACWAPSVDLLALVSDKQLVVCRLSWQRLWSHALEGEARTTWLPCLVAHAARLSSPRRSAGALTERESPWATWVCAFSHLPTALSHTICRRRKRVYPRRRERRGILLSLGYLSISSFPPDASRLKTVVREEEDTPRCHLLSKLARARLGDRGGRGESRLGCTSVISPPLPLSLSRLQASSAWVCRSFEGSRRA